MERHIKLEGWIDTEGSVHLRELLKSLEGRVVIDCSNLLMLQASAITELIHFENRVGRGNLILIDVSASVYRILKIVHYEHWCRNAFIFSKIILVPSIFLFS